MFERYACSRAKSSGVQGVWGRITAVHAETNTEGTAPRPNPFTAADVEAIVRQRGWLGAGAADGSTAAWMADAAALLGPHCESREAMGELLSRIFHYDAGRIAATVECHTVLVRKGARQVLRAFAHHLLDGAEVDSDRYKEVINAVKAGLPCRGRELFYTIRLALTGRAGEGELDRVILLMDRAARLPWAMPVKSARERILEFCAAVD